MEKAELDAAIVLEDFEKLTPQNFSKKYIQDSSNYLGLIESFKRGLSEFFNSEEYDAEALELFKDALRYLSPNDAVNFFNRVGTEKLIERCRAFTNASDINSYSQTNSELYKNIQMFINFFEQAKPELLEQGYLKNSTNDDTANFLHLLCKHLPTERLGSHRLLAVLMRNEGKQVLEITNEQRQRAAKLRPKLFQVKLSVLQTLKESIKHEDPTMLWKTACNALTKSYSADEVDEMLQLEFAISGQYTPLKFGETGSLSPITCGGIISIFHSIGYLERILLANASEKIQISLSKFCQRQADGKYSLNFKNYFQLVASGLEDATQSYIEIYQSLLQFDSDAQTKILDRIRDSLESKFNKVFKIEILLSRKDMALLEPELKKLKSKLKEQLEDNKTVPEILPNRIRLTGFNHSTDFRSINWKQKEYSLNKKQAQVIEFLYEQFVQGTPEVSEDEIAAHCELPDRKRVLKDLFKKAPVWEDRLISLGKTPRTYRLNIT